ncbi:AAA family ATPase [Sphingomonas sp. OTU376]|uniref:AAA family ATPase n=1 Tax=Sphingomonas sp. OTU376 TaxID=3043863 RepID=UPI00313AF911
MINLSGYNLTEARFGAATIRRAVSESDPPMFLLDEGGRDAVENHALVTRSYEMATLDAHGWSERPLGLTQFDGRRSIVYADFPNTRLDALIGRPMEPGYFLNLASAIAEVVAQMHMSGVVHRLLRPWTLVRRADQSFRIIALGRVQRNPAQDPGEGFDLSGEDLAFVSPEQVRRPYASDARSDLYSLGVIFYEMLTARKPFEARDALEWAHAHSAVTAPAPSAVSPHVPIAVSDIVMRLLAKDPEDRFQSAADLRDALARATGALPRVQSSSSPEGAGWRQVALRERDWAQAQLLERSSALIENGQFALATISGAPGAGKTVLVRSVRDGITAAGATFGEGKFSQLGSERPYAPLATALAEPLRALADKRQNEARPAERIRAMLGPDLSALANIFPELRVVVGEVPQPAEPGAAPELRLHRSVLRLVEYLADIGPLVLFIDDIQWAGPAFVRLFRTLIASGGVPNLLLILAYRDEEATARPDIVELLEQGRTISAFAGLPLPPLSAAGVQDVARELLGSMVASISDRVHSQSGGNPLHAVQLLAAISEKGGAGALRVWEAGPSGDLVALIIGKISDLPEDTRLLLCQAACLGQAIDASSAQVLWPAGARAGFAPAIEAGLIGWRGGNLEFAHDKVHEAALRLIGEQDRRRLHKEIGEALLAAVGPETVDDLFLAALSQVARGYEHVAPMDREGLARRFVEGARHAQASLAFQVAVDLLEAAEAMLGDDRWAADPRLSVAIATAMARALMLSGSVSQAFERLEDLLGRDLSLEERRIAIHLKVFGLIATDRYSEAIDVSLGHLATEGVRFARAPGDAEVEAEYRRLLRAIDAHPLETLVTREILSDEALLFQANLLSELIPASLSNDRNLFAMIILRISNITIESGNNPTGTYVFTTMNMVVGFRFGDFELGNRFGRTAMELIKRPELAGLKARAMQCFGALVLPWNEHVRNGIRYVEQGLSAALEAGDMIFAAYSRDHMQTLRYVSADPLPSVEREAKSAVVFAHNAGIAHASTFQVQVARARALQGGASVFGTLDDGEFSEAEYEAMLRAWPGLGMATFRYLTFKLEARLQAGRLEEALACSREAEALQWTCASFFDLAEYQLYSGLAAADALALDPRKTADLALRLETAIDNMRRWKVYAPENFHCRRLLLEGARSFAARDYGPAQEFFDQSIQAAADNGFVQIEAIAAERAGRAKHASGARGPADAYFALACRRYRDWGALGKARALAEAHPSLAVFEEPRLSPSLTLEQLDLGALLEALQAITAEVDPTNLMSTLMRLTVESAGATRATLYLLREGTLGRAASAGLRDGEVRVVPGDQEKATAFEARLTARVFTSGVREIAGGQDGGGPAVRGQPRSALCLPLNRKGALVGLLYLENDVSSRAFSEEQAAVLEFIAAQAAASLETAQLYEGLLAENQERQVAEESLRRSQAWLSAGQALSQTGSWRWNTNSGEVEWSAQHYEIFGLKPHSVVPTVDLLLRCIHPDDLEGTLAVMAQAGREASTFSHEYRIVRGGGEVRYIHGIGAPDPDGEPGAIIGAVMDVTERKLAEDAAREVQHDLAHASRLAMVGELAASIIHEINQPLAATVASAEGAQRWLSRPQPNLSEASSMLGDVISEATRVADIVAGLRALARKGETQVTAIDLQGAVDEVLVVMRSEFEKNQIQLARTPGSFRPVVYGQRVQLQQILINLLRNAIEAMRDAFSTERRIQLDLAVEGDQVRVTVSDSGPGIEPLLAKSLFDPLVTSKRDGMGMGLAISRSIAESHGGKLELLPSSAGARFSFTVPLTLPQD